MGKLIKTQLARLMMAAALLDVFWSAMYVASSSFAVLLTIVVDGDILILLPCWTLQHKDYRTSLIPLVQVRLIAQDMLMSPYLQCQSYKSSTLSSAV